MRGEQQLKAGRLKAADWEGEGGERGKRVSGKEGPKSLGWKLLSDLPQSNNSWSLSELFPKITEWLPLIYFLNMARLSVPLVNFPMRLSAYNLFPFFSWRKNYTYIIFLGLLLFPTVALTLWIHLIL